MSYKVSVSETDIFPVTTNVFASSYDQNLFLRKKLKFMCWLGSEMFLARGGSPFIKELIFQFSLTQNFTPLRKNENNVSLVLKISHP